MSAYVAFGRGPRDQVPSVPPHRVGKAPVCTALPLRVERGPGREVAEEAEKARVPDGTAAPVTVIKVMRPARTGSKAAGQAVEAVGAIGSFEKAKAFGFAGLPLLLVGPFAGLLPGPLALRTGGLKENGTTYGLFPVPLPVPPPPQSLQ